ncbi:DUF5615 family PIN-like protein [Sphingomonas oligoaromativorans]|uniref:DUF5615 family PIN-like protein n=1 Tax=Sphingomonas oligoaromativorans TaxID=575322 RepID=UPI001424A204|nr:DUF5615 family PIN-like protein [Sphingomonas oligoaromativorans]NIJ32804.1 hypothetical protein [Sphingomonas oligoaromativorans]
MSRARKTINFFTDNDVSDAVGAFLSDSGHHVTRLRDVMVNTSADEVIAAACRKSGQMLITHNVKHFKRIAKDYQVSHGEVDSLCRIELDCKQFIAKDRMAEALSLIEWEWERLGNEKKGFRISIGDNLIRIHR